MPRKPDLIWDTICELFSLKPKTKRELTRIGRVVKDLKDKEATVNDIHKVYRRCCKEWSGHAFGPEAVVKWFDQFQAGGPAADKPTGRVHS